METFLLLVQARLLQARLRQTHGFAEGVGNNLDLLPLRTQMRVVSGVGKLDEV